MKRSFLFVCLSALAIAYAADRVSISDLVKDPAKYDQKAVTVVGKVAKFRAKTSRAGNRYFTFTLFEGKDHIPVYGKGSLPEDLSDGVRAEATGVFAKERGSGDVVYKNELDVTSNGKDRYGVRVLPK